MFVVRKPRLTRILPPDNGPKEFRRRRFSRSDPFQASSSTSRLRSGGSLLGKPLRLMPVKNTTCSRFARRIGTRLFLVALPAALYACAGAHAADPQPSPSPERIKTVTARRGSVSPTMRISGVVAPYRQFGIATALNEPILEIRVREGERVGAGAVLAVLQTDDLQAQLASAQETTAEGDARLQQQRQQSTVNVGQYGSQVQNTRAAVAQAQSALAGAETDRARYLRLYDSGYLSQQVLAQQNVTIAQDRQAVRAARAQLVQTLQAEQLATSPGGLEASQIGAARNAAAAARLAVEGLRARSRARRSSRRPAASLQRSTRTSASTQRDGNSSRSTMMRKSTRSFPRRRQRRCASAGASPWPSPSPMERCAPRDASKQFSISSRPVRRTIPSRCRWRTFLGRSAAACR